MPAVGCISMTITDWTSRSAAANAELVKRTRWSTEFVLAQLFLNNLRSLPFIIREANQVFRKPAKDLSCLL